MDVPLLYFRAELPQTCFRSVSQSLRHWLCVRSEPVLHSTSLHLLIRQPVLLPAGTLTLPRWLRALSCWHRKATHPAGICFRCDSAFCLVSPSLLSPGCRPLAQAMRPLRTELVAALDGAGVLQPPPHRHLLVGLSFRWDTEILILIHDLHSRIRMQDRSPACHLGHARCSGDGLPRKETARWALQGLWDRRGQHPRPCCTDASSLLGLQGSDLNTAPHGPHQMLIFLSARSESPAGSLLPLAMLPSDPAIILTLIKFPGTRWRVNTRSCSHSAGGRDLLLLCRWWARLTH